MPVEPRCAGVTARPTGLRLQHDSPAPPAYGAWMILFAIDVLRSRMPAMDQF
jgi:hypothetical protein